MSDALEPIRQHVERDKRVAIEVIAKARDALHADVYMLREDITGAPSAARAFNRFKQGQLRAIEGVLRDRYFAKVETTIELPNESTEQLVFLVTKQRGNAGLDSEKWRVLSWTAPITGKLLACEIGHEVEFQAAQNRRRHRFVVEATATYGEILPEIRKTTYYLRDGQVYVEDERLLAPDAPLLPEIRPELPFEAAEEFGLSEIIELADLDQRQAMHLPFKETVLIEGPPGSGKTSIGLMRIPCLIDRQWDELGLDPSADKPFHEVGTMRVLVLNEEMVDYLGKLIRSVDVHGVRVLTLEKFCQKICRDGLTLSGRRVTESPSLSRLKFHPEAPNAYWTGFRVAIDKFWSRNRNRLSRALLSVGHDYGQALANRVDRWASAIESASRPNEALPQSINLAHVLREWREDCRRLRPDSEQTREHERTARMLTRLQQYSIRLARRLLNRHSIVRCVVQCDEFRRCFDSLQNQRLAEEATDEWVDQAQHRRVADSDGVLAAWLATYVSYVPTGFDRQRLGFVKSRLTHVLIDEAQDVSPCHLSVIQRLLEKDGTITMVGDLHQRITPHGHFDQWRDLVAGHVTKAVFSVNHRQSQPLGEFVRRLHACLYDKEPLWRASLRSGPLPRLRSQRGEDGLVQAVAEEVRYWREKIPSATVGILFHGPRWNNIRTLADHVETDLQDGLTDVHVAIDSGSAHFFSRTDCAIIATVRGTKGLEFDAVVIIDPHQKWKEPLGEIPMDWRNAMYVSASRARQGLSLVVDDRSVLMNDGIDSSLYERIVTEKV